MNREEMMEAAECYKPYIMFDEKEPFEITAVGITVFETTARSSSFPKREIGVDKEKVSFVLEYAIWYDYDIQHLYDLEHVWVYVGKNGQVLQAEGSFHGKYLELVNLDTGKPEVRDRTHVVVYAQPGKHACLSDPRLVFVVPDWYEACNEKAGTDGVLIQDFFADEITADDKLQKQTEKYIREKYGFAPSIRFYGKELSRDIFMTWEELRKSIPGRMKKQLDKIRKY